MKTLMPPHEKMTTFAVTEKGEAMREILFRGRTTAGKEWVSGFYAVYSTAPFIGAPNPQGTMLWFEVDPSTVGQYTGLTDKNGKKIFEGDIVRYTERKINGSDVPCIKQVEFAEGGWCVDCWFLNNWLHDGANGNIQLEEIEVIGNIHDNPELLEGGNDND